MSEQVGQKAWLLPTANNVGTYISAGTTTRDKSFIAEHPTLVTEGVFVTLDELAAHDAATRKEERAKVLEEAMTAVRQWAEEPGMISKVSDCLGRVAALKTPTP